MPRTRKPITTTLHGATGTGATLAEAKAHAAQRIQTAFADEYAYAPDMQRFPQGEIGLLYRELEGWHYEILWTTDTHKTCYGHGPYATKREARHYMCRHIAQQYTDHEASQYGLAFLSDDDTQGQQDHRYYIAWQHTCREALAQGMSHGEAHAYACEHTSRAA